MPTTLVVACAKSKRVSPEPGLRLRAVRGRDGFQRARRWVDRLAGYGEWTAETLYAGDHWQCAAEAGMHSSVRGDIWVCSAGYGLISASMPIRPYSATFTTGEPDSVPVDMPGGLADWWDAIAAWEGPAPGQPRRFTELVKSRKGAIVVALSASYLRAVTHDLMAAQALLEGHDRLAIICVGAPLNHPLADNLVSVSADVQAAVGGALISVNARVARRLITEVPADQLGVIAARKAVASWLSESPGMERVMRKVVDDSAVAGFIRSRIANRPEVSASSLLREFRDSGLACEQKRFSRLFQTVKES